jgi:predicted kinase
MYPQSLCVNQKNAVPFTEFQRVLTHAIKDHKTNGTALILRGLPGSGKSTLVKYIVEYCRRVQASVHVCLTTARSQESCSNGNNIEENDVYVTNQNDFRLAMKQKKSQVIVVDGMHIFQWEYKKYWHIALENSYRFIIIEFARGTLADALFINARSKHCMSEEWITDMYNRWEVDTQAMVLQPYIMDSVLKFILNG